MAAFTVVTSVKIFKVVRVVTVVTVVTYIKKSIRFVTTVNNIHIEATVLL